MSEYIYEIPALIPPKESVGLGGWGFDVMLDPVFAVKARGTEIPGEIYNNLQSQAKDIIGRFRLDDLGGCVSTPYYFVGGSYLLRFVGVPGDACDLGLDDFDLRTFNGEEWKELRDQGLLTNPVRYVPHNVDSRDQAYCLRELWLYWANTTRSLLKDKL